MRTLIKFILALTCFWYILGTALILWGGENILGTSDVEDGLGAEVARRWVEWITFGNVEDI